MGWKRHIDILNFTANVPVNHETASGVSVDLQMQGLVEHIHDLTRRVLLKLATPLPGFTSPAEPLPRAAGEPSSGGASPPSGGRASPETGERLRAPVPDTARRRTALRNKRIPRPNAVTRRVATEPTGAVTRYRDVHPHNNDNNNHAALVEIFQPSTLYKLRQLGLYTNTDNPDIAHQIDDGTVATEVAHSMTNT